jgi:uncharacterized protein
VSPAAHGVLVDTSADFAVVDRTDQHPAAAVAFVQTNDRPLVTTDLIVVETLNLVQARLGHPHAITLGKRLFTPATTPILKVTDADVAQAWASFSGTATRRSPSPTAPPSR